MFDELDDIDATPNDYLIQRGNGCAFSEISPAAGLVSVLVVLTLATVAVVGWLVGKS